MRDWDLVVFCGPSLSPDAARREVRGTLLPPARQGDVYRVLPRQPKVIALIDGLFESVPSVWHRELVAALEAGVTVFGASSMGALRAAELSAHGMIGIGQVYGWVADGTVADDSEVALLHAGAEHGFRAFTVPLVNVRFACEEGRRTRQLTPHEARALLAAGRAVHYQERSWEAILEQARIAPARREAVTRWLRSEAVDIKRQDALACLRAAQEFLHRGVPAPPLAVPGPIPSHARHRQLEQAPAVVGREEVAGTEILGALRRGLRGEALQAEGLRTLALAAYARSLGITVPEEILGAELGELERGLGPQLPLLALDRGQLLRMAEARCLERLVLEQAHRFFPDGPSGTEGLALAARLSGDWKAAARELVEKRKGRRPRRARKPGVIW